MTTPAEERASREGAPVLAVIPFELLRVAAGHPMMVQTLDGTEILLRLYKPEELMEVQKRAIEEVGPDINFGENPPYFSLAQAENMTRPIVLTSDDYS